MLGFVTSEDRGSGDRLLAQVAGTLAAQGVRLAGVVQINTEVAPDRPCLMDLSVLPHGAAIRISQSLGAHAAGCRLDSSQLEEAVGQVGTLLGQQRPDLLILNKFGKAEAEGRGFRPLIGEALIAGLPILTQVAAKNRKAFDDFAQGMAAALPSDHASVLAWCRSMIGAQTGREHAASPERRATP